MSAMSPQAIQLSVVLKAAGGCWRLLEVAAMNVIMHGFLHAWLACMEL
jgi:hypothetical protein